MTVQRRNTRGVLLGATALAGALALMATPAAAQQASYNFDLPAQPLETALEDYARTANQQLIFADVDVRGFNAPAVRGAYSPEDALELLLAGTDLQVRRTASGVVQIAAATDPQSQGAAGDGAEGTVDTLIVTAQKREEDIQDVPIAISAFTQEALERSQIAGGADLMTQVPNMTFTKTNFTGYSIQLRGIGTQAISATTDAAVAVAFNNSSFIRNRFFEQEFYDLQRVEVLRGPQGTLYGRNATAGVVNLISQKPSFNYEAKLSGDIANYSSTRLEGMVNVPLVEDKVALRLAGAWTKREGYVTNQITGSPIDGRDLWSTRLSLRFAPTDRLDANLIWEHFEEDDDRLRSGKQLCHQDDRLFVGSAENPLATTRGGYAEAMSQGCIAASLYSPDSFEAPNGFSLPYYYPIAILGVPIIDNLFDPYESVVQSRDLRVIESTVDPKYRAKSDVFELQVNYDLSDALTLTSETTYSADSVFSLEDYNRFNTASGAFGPQTSLMFRPETMHQNDKGFWEFCDPQIGCADRLVGIDVSSGESRQFSQEFRVASDYDGLFNFSLGGNYLRYDTEDKYYVFINTLTMFSTNASTGVEGIPFQNPWQQNGTDNTECLSRGQPLPDPTTFADLQGCIYIDPNPIGSLNDLGHNYFLSKNPYKLISYALFGESYWQLSDNLKLTAGLRVTRDMKEAPRIPSWLIAGSSVGYPVLNVEEQRWTKPTGRLALDWKPDLSFTDETLLYASYSHGYKAGGSNPPPAAVIIWPSVSDEDATVRVNQSTAAPKTFDPEFVDAFELGAKNTLADGKVTLNLAAFYYDYKGYQISQIVDRSAVNYNFDADIWGLEIEADWRPLENLRFGFKGGYENTRIADGEHAIDIMDRTGGHDDWIVVKPFPSFSSNCILPDYVLDPDGDGVGGVGGSGGTMTSCEFAYLFGQDPVTRLDYVEDPELWYSGFGIEPIPESLANYRGFNPDTAPNNGEGFFTELGGNELPNAPHFTATITADYTVPLPNDWLATLHTDLYYQSEAWTRVFNTEGYDKLKAYTNVNVAAVFTNETAGWKVMAYVKNVFDRDSITGAFLNSDDSGLTTNVFLTEPRLYGLRVTKDFDGGPWWTGASGTGPFPLWIELGGGVSRHEADYETIRPAQFALFPDSLDPTIAQHRDLDRGDQRDMRITYKPTGSRYSLRGEYRVGDANNGTTRVHATQVAGPERCSFDPNGPFAFFCYPTPGKYITGHNWSDSFARDHEEHTLASFEVGVDVGLGSLSASTISAGLRYGQFKSRADVFLDGVPNMQVPDGWYFEHPTLYNRSRSTIDSEREFEGVGPMLTWDAARPLLGDDAVGHVDLDWSVSGGVLFGKQETAENELNGELDFASRYVSYDRDANRNLDYEADARQRSKSATVPFVNLNLGLSYEIQRVKIGAGYRWERYFDVLDAGYAERQEFDRTIDGPYFKLAVGFGG